MTSGALAEPRGQFVSNLAIVSAATNITYVTRDTLPGWPVPGGSTSQGMRDFVQQNLMNLVVVKLRSQIARDGNASFCVVAEPRTAFRVIETKAPR